METENQNQTPENTLPPIVECIVTRTRGGAKVTVTVKGTAAAATIRDALRADSQRHGYSEPYEYHGLQLWNGGEILSLYGGSSARIPNVPNLGTWILRADALGSPEGVTITLPLPQGTDKLKAAAVALCECAKAVYYDVCKPINIHVTATMR